MTSALTYLFISHDLGVIQHISDRVVVMYVGRAVEIAPTDELFVRPLHPYTEALLLSIPRPDPTRRTDEVFLSGETPSPVTPPSGCYFHPRCKYAAPRCAQEAPPLRAVAPGREVACHFAETMDLRGARIDVQAGIG